MGVQYERGGVNRQEVSDDSKEVWRYLLEQLAFVLDFYYRPLAAASRVLDQGRLLVAVVLALVVAGILQIPAQQSESRAMAEQYRKMAELRARASRGETPAPNAPAVTLDEDGVPQVPGVPATRRPAITGTGFQMLVVLAAFFVPAAILLLAAWDGLGSAGQVLQREYVPLLMTLLFAWVAARVPVAALVVLSLWQPAVEGILPAAMTISLLYFLALSALCLRTVLGASVSHAVVAVVVASVAGIAGQAVYSVMRPGFYMLASPWLLYYGYMSFQGDVRSFGQTLRSRQSLRRGLEAAAINPHDADAQYQLGLIYRARRNNTEAEARFRKAIEIQPDEGDALFELGRLLREQKRVEEALPLLEKAAKLNDKQSSSEVWREIGAARLELGKREEAIGALQKYVDRREYDPEGLYWLGLALKQAGRGAEAKALFSQAIEAVDTSPRHRKGQLRRWSSLARGEREGL